MFVGRRLQPAPSKRIGAHGLRQNSGAGWSLRPPDWARLTDWPGKRRLPRAPKELSVIESGGSTRPIPLFYNGVNCLHLGDQFAMFVETNRQKSLDRRSDLARVIVWHDRSRLEPATQNESRLEPATDQRIVTLAIISTSHPPLNSIPPPCKLPREDMPPWGRTRLDYPGSFQGRIDFFQSS